MEGLSLEQGEALSCDTLCASYEKELDLIQLEAAASGIQNIWLGPTLTTSTSVPEALSRLGLDASVLQNSFLRGAFTEVATVSETTSASRLSQTDGRSKDELDDNSTNFHRGQKQPGPANARFKQAALDQFEESGTAGTIGHHFRDFNQFAINQNRKGNFGISSDANGPMTSKPTTLIVPEHSPLPKMTNAGRSNFTMSNSFPDFRSLQETYAEVPTTWRNELSPKSWGDPKHQSKDLALSNFQGANCERVLSDRFVHSHAISDTSSPLSRAHQRLTGAVNSDVSMDNRISMTYTSPRDEYGGLTQSILQGAQGQGLNADNFGFISTREQFRKTKLCVPFMLGECRKGDHCPFAHGESELRNPVNLVKTKLCDNYFKGTCFNQSCPFAHSETELRFTNDFYKTGLCKYWKRGIPCVAGAKCRHAHGVEQLRPVKGSQSRGSITLPRDQSMHGSQSAATLLTLSLINESPLSSSLCNNSSGMRDTGMRDTGMRDSAMRDSGPPYSVATPPSTDDYMARHDASEQLYSDRETEQDTKSGESTQPPATKAEIAPLIKPIIKLFTPFSPEFDPNKAIQIQVNGADQTASVANVDLYHALIAFHHKNAELSTTAQGR